MSCNPDRHHRRSIRLKGYDYGRPGVYFATICTQGRECLLGQIVDGVMQLNDAGRMVRTTWEQLPDRYPGVEIDEHIVMPKHIHGIVIITDTPAAPVGADLRVCPDPAGSAPVYRRRCNGSKR